MLTELHVRDFAVIADARLELAPGLNVLTGETGAGKSMLVDALALLLGERAATDLVRPGGRRAVVEGLFDLSGRPDLLEAMEAVGIAPEEGSLVLKREIQPAGPGGPGARSRAWANGTPVTVGTLAELGQRLVDLHGQHETQSLLKPDAQRAMLDAVGGLDAAGAAAAVAEAFETRERLLAEQRSLSARLEEARRRADYLRHVVDEISRAAAQPGELESLEAEARRLAHAEELGALAAELAQRLEGEAHPGAGMAAVEGAGGAGGPGGVAPALAHAGRLLGALERIDARGVAGWRELLDAAAVNVSELARGVREYAEGIELDPSRLAAVERRRDTLYRLDQKYGPTLERVLATFESARRELELLDTADTDLAALAHRVPAAQVGLVERCRALTAARTSAASRLSRAVSRHLAALGMEGGRFRVGLEPLAEPTRHGAERVEFLVQLNPGLDERPVARVASGGELSRLMLALKVELARHDALCTLVFDEVDQGIGGQVAGRVAAALARVARMRQVLVITHLPQIAAAADRHLVIAKAAPSGVAEADVRALDSADRVEEIARMLGGGGGAEGGPARATAVRHAEELLRRAGRERQETR